MRRTSRGQAFMAQERYGGSQDWHDNTFYDIVPADSVQSDPFYLEGVDVRDNIVAESPGGSWSPFWENDGGCSGDFNDPDGSRNDMGAFGGPWGSWSP